MYNLYAKYNPQMFVLRQPFGLNMQQLSHPLAHPIPKCALLPQAFLPITRSLVVRWGKRTR